MYRIHKFRFLLVEKLKQERQSSAEARRQRLQILSKTVEHLKKMQEEGERDEEERRAIMRKKIEAKLRRKQAERWIDNFLVAG